VQSLDQNISTGERLPSSGDVFRIVWCGCFSSKRELGGIVLRAFWYSR
jgi:hypothetical protein